MTAVVPRRDIVLGPGDFFFGDGTEVIRTLLGSCVAITLWHPRTHVGGMCHFVVPQRGDTAAAAAVAAAAPGGPTLDGRYADEAMTMFEREILRFGRPATQYEAKIFGGGNQFPMLSGAPGFDVAERNVAVGLQLLRDRAITVVGAHLGRSGPRQVVFDRSTGSVWLRHTEPPRKQGR